MKADLFWKAIYPGYPHRMTPAQIQAELTDYAFIIEQLPKVYYHITNGQLSKHMYSAETVIGVADDHVQELIDEAVEDARKEYLATLKLAATRLGILRDRMEGCNAQAIEEGRAPTHELISEAQMFVDEIREVYLEAAGLTDAPVPAEATP